MTIDLSGAKWFKSSRSSAGNDCVEVAHLSAGSVGVRDSKNPTGPALVFTSGEWDAFLADTTLRRSSSTPDGNPASSDRI